MTAPQSWNSTLSPRTSSVWEAMTMRVTTQAPMASTHFHAVESRGSVIYTNSR